ncbi:MAG TPA: patatin-like phospholipase family protein [Stellaceae bacterium]|nr:patatin-like phospholipase family protein [Stellaceae bacterium]
MPREASDNLWVALISKVAPFSYLAEDEIIEIADSFTWFTALGGKTIIHQGDPSDELFIVVSGALGVYIRTDSGPDRFVGRIGPGETVGEMGLISGEPRSATVRCLRDAELLAITKKTWDAFAERHPGALLAITQTLITRLRAAQSDQPPKPFERSLAIIPSDPQLDIEGFARKLVASLSTYHSVVCVTKDVASGRSLDFFREIEAGHHLVVYVAEAGPSSWTQLCLRQADSLIMVGRGADEAHAFDAMRFDSTPEFTRPMDLVLVWAPGETIKGTAGWLALHDFKMHHHIRGDSDIERLARLMTGRAIGLVLAGGGARGVAHVGVIWALRDNGIPIDIVGGTSIGSIIAGMAALEWPRERMLHCYRDTFSGRSPLTDFTIPTVALLAGRRLTQWLEKWYGDVAIEDLPIWFFCLSTNLTKGGPAVHTRGKIATWIRASISIPGILPPLIDDGQIYVDGGVINNMPVDVVRQIGRGPAIAVDIHSDTPFTAKKEPNKSRFGWRSAPLSPSIFQLLWRVATINAAATYGSARFRPDVLLKPNLGTIGLLDWKGLEGTIGSAYEYTVAHMDEIKEKLATTLPSRNW